MVEFSSDALERYFSDKAVRQAVDSLVEVADGEPKIELDLDSFAHFNDALLSALQVRRDFAEMMRCIWIETYGQVSEKRPCMFPDIEMSIKACWKSRWFYIWYYPSGKIDKGDGAILGVHLSDDMLSMRANFYSHDGYDVGLGPLARLAEWDTITDADWEEGETAEFKIGPIAQFLQAPDKLIAAAQEPAAALIKAIPAA